MSVVIVALIATLLPAFAGTALASGTTVVVKPSALNGWTVDTTVLRNPAVPTTFSGPTDANGGAGSFKFGPIGSVLAAKLETQSPEVSTLASNFGGMQYQFQVLAPAAVGVSAKQFYTNVYVDSSANTIGTTASWYDCRYSYVPLSSVSGWNTFSFDASSTPSGSAKPLASCPSTLSGLPAGSQIMFFRPSGGDQSGSDIGLVGAYDLVAITIAGHTTTYDFEPESACTTECYVNAASGNDAFGGDTPASAKRTIQAGVTAVSPAGTVHVAAGTYSGTGNTNIQIAKSLTIVGDPGTPGVAGPGPNAPVIDGGGTVKDGFDLANGVSDVTITGFVIRNLGTPALNWVNGDGVAVQAYVPSTHDVTVSHNLVQNVGYGVLVGNDGSSPKYALGTHTGWSVSENIAEGLWSVGFELTDTSSSNISNNVIHLGAALDAFGYGPIGVFSWTRINQSDLTIIGNTIDGAQHALPAIYIYARSAPPSGSAPSPNLDGLFIHHNVITSTVGTSPLWDGQVAVRDRGTGTVTNVHVTNNSLLSLNNGTAVTVDGTCNWWGQASGPSGSQVIGSATTVPWLISSDLSGDCTTPPLLGSAAADANGNEGDTLDASGSFDGVRLTITSDASPVTFTDNGDGTWSWSLPTTDDVAPTTVHVTATDAYGNTAFDDFDYSAANVAPVVTLSGPNAADEGQIKNYTFSTVDPGNEVYALDSSSCGANGTLSNQAFNSTDGSGSFDCTFIDGDFSSTVSVAVSDGDGGSDSDAILASVANVAPVVSTPTVSMTNNTASVSANFTDPGSADTHTCSIDWGDTSNSAGVIGGTNTAGTCSGSHTYALPGTYTITVTVTDKDAGVGSATTTTAVNPRAVKQGVVTSLPGLKTGDKETDKKIDSAIKFLNESLDPSLWNGANALDPKHGNKVFEKEKEAVHKLGEIKNPSAGVTNAIKMLVAVDRSLAEYAITNAPLVTKQKDIDKANEEMAKGDADWAAGKFENAIEHYKNAWEKVAK